MQLSRPEDFLTPTERALEDIRKGAGEIIPQVGRGLSEVGHRTAIGVSELVGADKAAANLRASRELSREVYGEPETITGTAANVATQLVGEGVQFLVPGAAVSRVSGATRATQAARAAQAAARAGDVARAGELSARAAQAQQAVRGGRFTRLLTNPQGVAERAAQNFLTGAPIDVAISQAGAEETMAGALGALTGDEELDEIAKDRVSAAAFEATGGFLAGEALGEGLEAISRIRARRRARAPRAPEVTADQLEGVDQGGFAIDVEPEGPTLRRRAAEAIDPSLRAELELAYTDPISGLRNQAAFQRAKPRLDADPNTELVILDLANFKAVNDNLGLEAGDQVLREVGAIVRRSGLEQRQLFRAGGDEFVIAAPKGRGEELGRRIQQELGERPIEGTPFSLSARYGVGDTFRLADEAAAAAKAVEEGPRARDVVARQEAPAREIYEPTPEEQASRRANLAEVEQARAEIEAAVEARGAASDRGDRAGVEAASDRLDAARARLRELEAPQEAPGAVPRETPTGAPIRAPDAAPAPAARAEGAPPARPRSLTEQARDPIRTAIRQAAGRTAGGAAAGAAIGAASEDITAVEGGLAGAAVAAGFPGIARAINRVTPGTAGHLALPGGRKPGLRGRWFSKAAQAMESPKAPGKGSADAWLGYLKGQGASEDELASISRGFESPALNEKARFAHAAEELRKAGMLEEAALVDELQGMQLNATRSIEMELFDRMQMGQISNETFNRITDAVGKAPRREPARPSFSREEAAKIVEDFGLRARFSEQLRGAEFHERQAQQRRAGEDAQREPGGDEEPDEPDLDDLDDLDNQEALEEAQGRLSDAEERLMEQEGEIEHYRDMMDDYEEGGTTYDELKLELEDLGSRWMTEFERAVIREGGEIEPDDYDALLDHLMFETEQDAAYGHTSGGRVLQSFWQKAEELLGETVLRQPRGDPAQIVIPGTPDPVHVPPHIFDRHEWENHDLLEEKVEEFLALAQEHQSYATAWEDARDTLEQIREEVSNIEREIEDIEAGEPNVSLRPVTPGLLKPPKFASSMNQAGGRNYHEILIQLDEGLYRFVVPEHFSEEDVMAFIRAKHRDAADGSLIYHVEENQSDAHQRGRKYGYRMADGRHRLPHGWTARELDSNDIPALKKWVEDRNPTDEVRRALDGGIIPPAFQFALVDAKGRVKWPGPAVDEVVEKYFAEHRSILGPDMPFKSTKEWTLVTIKRALVQAIEDGASWFTWASGAQAADNYNLARYGITKIEYEPESRRLRAYKNDRVEREDYVPEEGRGSLDDLIGHDLAERLLETPQEASVARTVDMNIDRDELLQLQLGRTYGGEIRRQIEGGGEVQIEQRGGWPWHPVNDPEGTMPYEAQIQDARGDAPRSVLARRELDPAGRIQLTVTGHGGGPGWPDGPFVSFYENQDQLNEAFDRILANTYGIRWGAPYYEVRMWTTPGSVDEHFTARNWEKAVNEVQQKLRAKSVPPFHQLKLERGVQLGGHSQKAYYDGIYTPAVKGYLKTLKTDAQVEPIHIPGMKMVINDRFTDAPKTRPDVGGYTDLQEQAVTQFRGWLESTANRSRHFAADRTPESGPNLDAFSYAAGTRLMKALEEGSSGADAIAKSWERIEEIVQGTAEGAPDQIRARWKEILEEWEELHGIEAWTPPPTNLGFRITDDLKQKVLLEGQRMGYIHPALLRTATGAMVGLAGGAGVSDELGIHPALGAFLGASLGAGIPLRSLGRRGIPGPISRRAVETFNPVVSDADRVDPLAFAEQASERFPSAGQFRMDGEVDPNLVSPKEIIDELAAALDESMEGLGLKVAEGFARTAGVSRGTLGFLRPRQQVIRQLNISDVPVFGHEAGHAMQKILFGATKKGALSEAHLKRLPAQVQGELLGMAARIDPDRTTLKEGWAEFWRRYLDNPDALTKEAPEALAEIERRLEGYPEIKAAWMNARADWTRFRESDARSRVWAKISVGDREVDNLTIRDKWSRFRTSVIDDMEPVVRIVRKIREAVGIESFQEEADQLARLVRGAEGVGVHFLEHGALDFRTHQKVGPGLKDILAPVKEQLDDFRVYMVARRAQELHARDKLTGFRAEDVDAAVRQMDAQHGARFAEAFDQVQQWNEGLLRYLKDSGVMSEQSYRAILELNQSYTPFYRVIEGGQAGSLGQTFGHLFSPVKRFKGSGRDLIDPLESLAKNALLYTQVAQKQQVSRALGRLADKEGVGPVLEQIGTPIKRSEFRLGEIEKQLEDVLPGAKELLEEARAEAQAKYDALTEGMSQQEIAESGIVFEDPGEELLAFYRPGDYLGRPNTISVLQDGQRVYYEVDKELFAALEGLNTEQLDSWARFLSLPARTLRAGATLAPEFAIRNPARDQVMAFVQSEYGFLPGVDLARGIFELVRKGDAYQQWIASGGYRAALTSLDRETMQNAVRSLVEGGGMRNVIKHPFDGIQALSALMENGTRMGEFLRGRAAEARRLNVAPSQLPKEVLQRIGLSSREVTTDFARHGAKTATIRILSAFWNARLQGYDRLFREAKNNPRRFAAKAFGIITVPSLLEYYSNMDDPDYWEKPQWQRDLFWHIRLGDDWLVVPKPFELGLVFGTLPVRILDSMMAGPGGATELRQFLGEFAKGEVSGTFPVPTFAEPLLENATNYSFFLRRPIVPRAEQGIHGYLQSGPGTSEVANQLARWTYDAPLIGNQGEGRSLLGSPRAIDNVLFGWTGGLGRLATEVTDPFLQGRLPFTPGEVPEIGTRFTETPGLRGVLDPQAGFSSESIERFYRELRVAREAVQSLQFFENAQDDAAYQAELDDPELARLRSIAPSLEAASDELTVIRAQVEAIRRDPTMDSQQKRSAVDELGLAARQLAAQAIGRQLPPGNGNQ